MFCSNLKLFIEYLLAAKKFLMINNLQSGNKECYSSHLYMSCYPCRRPFMFQQCHIHAQAGLQIGLDFHLYHISRDESGYSIMFWRGQTS
jgi:hypothetical protein